MKVTIPRSFGTLLILFAICLQSSRGQFFRTPCSDDTQCESKQMLQCLNGFCQCDSRSQTYDYKLSQCATLAGKFCDVHNGYGPKCSRNSACILSRCECQPGYSVNSDFLCKPNFQSNPCQTSQDCDGEKGLICIESSCQCYNASLTYQGLFGCIDPTDPNFIEMMTTLKRTESLLSENRINLEEMLGDEDLSESQASLQSIDGPIQSRQLFEDSYSNTHSDTDLLGASQNQNNQQAPGLGGLLSLFRGLSTGLPQLSQLFRNLPKLPGLPGLPGLGRPAQGGYPASGVPQNQQPQQGNNIFSIFTQFMKLLNQFLPAIRQFKMLLNPLRFIQRLISNFRKPGLGGYAAARPTTGPGSGSGYGPPSNTATPQYGPPSLLPAVTGGYNVPSTSAPGPAPQASRPVAQAIDQNYQTLPIQSQPSFQNFQTQQPNQNFQAQPIQNFQNTQPIQSFQNQQQAQNFQNQQPLQNFQNQPSQNFQTQPIQSFQQAQPTQNFQPQQATTQQSNNFEPIASQSQFQNQNTQRYQNLNTNQIQNQNFQSQQGFTQQNQQFQNLPQSQNFQNTGGPIDNIRPFVQPQQESTVPPSQQVSKNQYPRQERFSFANSDSDDESPYLPEHL